MSKANDAATERYAELRGIERAHRGRDGGYVGVTPEVSTRKAPYPVPIPDWGNDLNAAVREAAQMAAPASDGGAAVPMEVRLRFGHILGTEPRSEHYGAQAEVGTSEMLRVYGRGSASMVRDGCESVGRLCALAVTRAMVRMREGEGDGELQPGEYAEKRR